MPCRNDYLRMVRLAIQRNIKECYTYRANDFEIGIQEKTPSDNKRSKYLAIFDINDLLRHIKSGSILNCECIERKHKMCEFLKK